MDIDITGSAPKASTLGEANQLISHLWSLIGPLSAQIESLTEKNKQLQEKVASLEESNRTNSKNSSLAPSKDRTSKSQSNAKRNAKRRKNPKKQGGQPGHTKHERALFPAEKVDSMVSCLPNKHCGCGGTVLTHQEVHRRHQQYEFPVIKPIVTEYQIYAGVCEQCEKKQIGKLPTGVSPSMLGPRATAMTAHLSGTYRISKKNIANM